MVSQDVVRDHPGRFYSYLQLIDFPAISLTLDICGGLGGNWGDSGVRPGDGGLAGARSAEGGLGSPAAQGGGVDTAGLGELPKAMFHPRVAPAGGPRPPVAGRHPRPVRRRWREGRSVRPRHAGTAPLSRRGGTNDLTKPLQESAVARHDLRQYVRVCRARRCAGRLAEVW